ncbi:hypothetical protein [Rubritalea tangerina]
MNHLIFGKRRRLNFVFYLLRVKYSKHVLIQIYHEKDGYMKKV